ncbi:MAG TPA: hypothetical protein VGQ37_12140 [Vicinamibacterales bacterium]|nr:hypothetical protein [Vicinamibacterales bacterium]
MHYSSGLADHFFYLLAEGTAPAGGPASRFGSPQHTAVAAAWAAVKVH